MVKCPGMAERFPDETAQQRTYRAFETLAAGNDASIDLAQAALLIASLEYPDLDTAHYINQLDTLARRVRMLLKLPEEGIFEPLDSLSTLHAINQILFTEEHFHGNQADYMNPQNSFLNCVLDERIGIPITLSLLYMEVARRTEGKSKLHAHWFTPVSSRQLLYRMLNNLKQIYLRNDDYVRGLTMCNLMVILMPRMVTERRDRGLMHLQLKHYARALHDLMTYVELAPKAKDRFEILNQVKSILQIMSMLN